MRRKRPLDCHAVGIVQCPIMLRWRVRARRPNEKIGKRAVLHYRLPTEWESRPDWSIAPDWNRWVAVERLAADRPRLERLAAAYLAHTRNARDWAKISARLAFDE